MEWDVQSKLHNAREGDPDDEWWRGLQGTLQTMSCLPGSYWDGKGKGEIERERDRRGSGEKRGREGEERVRERKREKDRERRE